MLNESPTVLSVEKCGDYEPTRVGMALETLMAPLGGFQAFVRPGMKVLLKPNMLSAKPPKEAVTTHPTLIQAVSAACKKLVAEVFIGDSPPLTTKNLEGYWEITGFAGAAAKSGGRLVSFERDGGREERICSGSRNASVRVTSWYDRCDLVINLPKLKTHNLTIITGAVKNHFGLLPGLQKANLHAAFPKPGPFGALMADIAAKFPSDLSIMDAVEGMDGQGPAGGRVIRTGYLLASVCPVAVDYGFCRIAGIDPEEVPMLRTCRETGFGPGSFAGIRAVGASLDGIRFPGFQVPRQSLLERVPDALARFAGKLIRTSPRLKPGLCILCGACHRVCASKAIKMGQAGPDFDARRCISCFCCMEVCPKDAIEISGSALVNLAFRIRRLKHLIQGRPV